MSGNIKLRWFVLPFLLTALFVISIPPVVSWAVQLEDAQRWVRQNPNNADLQVFLGTVYAGLGRFQEAISHSKEAIRIKPDFPEAYVLLGLTYEKLGQYQDAIASYKEGIRINPDQPDGHYGLGQVYDDLGQYQDAIASYKEAIRIKPDYTAAHYGLGNTYARLAQYQDAIASYKVALRIDPNHKARNKLNKLEQKIAQAKPAPQFSDEESDRLARERRLLEEERRKFEDLRLAEKNRQRQAQAKKKPTPQSGTGSGFFVSKMGHVITNAHVVQSCNKVTIGDNANKQVPAEIVNTDRSNDLALLKLSTLEMASAESKSLIQKLGVVVVPLAANGLLRDEDVRLGEKVLVAGYPFGELFSNTIKVTTGVVSATRGAGDDSGQFQLDAAVQPGNSGGPIYDSSGNIVGVVISQLDKLKMAKAIGSLPENVNFGIKASTVRQFLISSGVPSKKSERTEEKSTEQLAEIAQNQALMVMCLQ